MKSKNQFEVIFIPIILIICGCISHLDGVDGVQCTNSKEMLARTLCLIISFTIIYVLTSNVYKKIK
jgi:hypothetical protein